MKVNSSYSRCQNENLSVTKYSNQDSFDVYIKNKFNTLDFKIHKNQIDNLIDFLKEIKKDEQC